MKAQRGRGVEIEIRMVNHVETPQERHPMRHYMPQIERVVHEDKYERDFGPLRQTQPGQQAPTPGIDKIGKRKDRKGSSDRKRNCRNPCNGEVSSLAPKFGFHTGSK